jgi:hypothetical protein
MGKCANVQMRNLQKLKLSDLHINRLDYFIRTSEIRTFAH